MKILYIQYTNPGGYPPLEHSSNILAQNNWQVLFLGTEVSGVSALCFPDIDNVSVKLMPFRPSGWRQKLHYLQFSLWVLIWTLVWRPQWVYASDLLSCPATSLLSLLTNVKVIYHEHDSHVTTHPNFFIRFCFKTRTWLANRANICILPNHKRAEQFTLDTGKKQNVICVWNCPTQAEASSERQPSKTDGLQILYHGTIVPSRLPLSVLKALAMLPSNVKLRVIGYETLGHPTYVQELQNLADELGITNQLELVAPMPRYELLKQCQDCDVGLAFMPIKNNNDINLEWMIGASNKPFDYLACGLALLVSDLPEWKQMYVEAGYALTCNPEEPESIAAVLKWYLDHPLEMREMGHRGQQRILEEWNYEVQFLPVMQLMQTNL